MDTKKPEYEIYDDRTNEVLFVHYSSYVCSRFIDNRCEEKGESHRPHLWLREYTGI